MGTRHQGPERERLALATYVKLVRAAESLTARLAARLAEAGLTTSQFAVLEALFHLGPLCQVELARKILKSSGNLTTVVDNLERNGLVVRRRDTADRRKVTVELTPAGEALVAKVFPRHVRSVVDELGVLSPEEQLELGRLARRVGRGPAGEDQPQPTLDPSI